MFSNLYVCIWVFYVIFDPVFSNRNPVILGPRKNIHDK